MRITDILSGKNIIVWASRLIIFLALTIVTQIGGIIYLLCIPAFIFSKTFGLSRAWYFVMRVFIFSVFYSLATFYIVPVLAENNGRVPMPFAEQDSLVKPHNFLTVLLNRRYVVVNVRNVIELAAQKTAKTYPGTITEYLECGFPFGEYPMRPHLSHNDGRKIDISFFYFDADIKQRTNERPSWLGYGASEGPKLGEQDQPTYCAQKGYWAYSFMKRITPQNTRIAFDAPRNRDFMRYLLSDNRVQIIMIEPHLQTRLGLDKNNKVKSPPCISVRHDDHIHVSIY